uniref:Uncharacterized protein n=1 Tax=Sphaerodactylus townsendi TaxID=933632 RepID=A0ACB8FDJ5_9SAUR
MPQKALLAKIVMAGEPEVGKTSILRQYTQTSLAQPASFIATIGEGQFCLKISVKFKSLTLEQLLVIKVNVEREPV